MTATAQRLTRAGLNMVEFPQTVPNLTAASQNLFELVKGQNLIVYPDDDIRLAISRAVAVETSRGWRIAKDKQTHKVDIIVALAQATLGAVRKGGFQMLINGKTPEEMEQHLAWGRQQRAQRRGQRFVRPPSHLRARDTIKVVQVSEQDADKHFRYFK